jgi:hypothetical protein
MVTQVGTKTKERYMFGLLQPDPTRALERGIARKRLEAVEVQCSGNLRAFTRINGKIVDLEDTFIDELSRRTEG